MWKSYLKSTLHLNYKDCEIKILQLKNDIRCGVPKPNLMVVLAKLFLPCFAPVCFQSHISLPRPYNLSNVAGGILPCLCVCFSAGYGPSCRRPSQLKTHLCSRRFKVYWALQGSTNHVFIKSPCLNEFYFLRQFIEIVDLLKLKMYILKCVMYSISIILKNQICLLF